MTHESQRRQSQNSTSPRSFCNRVSPSAVALLHSSGQDLALMALKSHIKRACAGACKRQEVKIASSSRMGTGQRNRPDKWHVSPHFLVPLSQPKVSFHFPFSICPLFVPSQLLWGPGISRNKPGRRIYGKIRDYFLLKRKLMPLREALKLGKQPIG